MKAELFLLLDEIEREKGISRDIILDALESALISAYKRNYGAVSDINVNIDEETGNISVHAKKTVADEVEDRETQVSLDDARKINPSYQVGDIVETEVTPSSFGRIAAQTARQVILQRMREAEREQMFDKFSDRTNDIMTAVVRRIENRNVMLELGDTESVLIPSEQVRNDNYKVGARYKVYVIEVANSTRGVHLVVSRSHPGLVRRLFELEVPEIADGIIEIKALSREPGSRSKIAVASNSENVDPVGTCIGPKGMRVQAVIEELRGEKVDIVRYSDDPAEYIAQALSPADVVSIEVDKEKKLCRVRVPDDQLSLAIGKEGQNARLAARLTGWKIDLKGESYVEEAPKDESAEKEESAESEETQE